jgi:hypothetical protein
VWSLPPYLAISKTVLAHFKIARRLLRTGRRPGTLIPLPTGVGRSARSTGRSAASFGSVEQLPVKCRTRAASPRSSRANQRCCPARNITPRLGRNQPTAPHDQPGELLVLQYRSARLEQVEVGDAENREVVVGGASTRSFNGDGDRIRRGACRNA